MRASIVLLALLAIPATAQQPRQLTADDYARAERSLAPAVAPLIVGLAGRATWLADGRFWYRTSVPNGNAFFVVDPARRTREALFDATRLATALAAASGGRVDANRLPFQTVDLAKDNRAITVSVRNRRWSCDLQQYTCAPADSSSGSAAAPQNSSVSPDGRTAVFIKDYNLYAKDLASGRETQLTTDGVKDFGYATDNAGWVHSDRPIVSWSPDSRQLATYQQDERGTRDMYLVSPKAGAPQLEAWKYPLPGDSVIFRVSRVVIKLNPVGAPVIVRFQMPPDQHRSTVSDHIACAGGICDVEWYPDGSHLAFVSSSRDHKTAWFRVADAQTGAVRTLFEEHMPTQVGDASLRENLWRVLPASNELIWWSQRANWLHLYLYDLTTGQLKNQITTGEGNVDDIVRVDEKQRQVYFMRSGQEQPVRDPYFQQLYKIGFDGRGLTLVTPENANHVVTASPNGAYFVDSIDGMGTPGRSKAFADFYYGHMGDNTLPDQVAGMRELAQRYRFIDIDKAGIWGHSGGGFATADAMFRFPDFFKVGISESGNHDNRVYEDDWGERYQGLLVRSDGGDNYAEEANQTHAKNLKGKLMLVHGLMDDNVPPYNTTLVVDALVKAGKDFDLLMFPFAHHGYGADANYAMRRRWDYFVRNLMGAEPPKDYQIGKGQVVP